MNIIYLGDKLVRKDYKKKANYQDSFEDLYLKHDYLTRVKKYETDIRSYENIVKTTANIMYEKYRMTFNKVGFYTEDIVNISWTYLHSFLGLYSFETDPQSLDNYKKAFFIKKQREPTQEEISRKERNNIIHFLRQKIQTCVLFCERKSRNIVASKGHIAYFAFTEKSIPVSYSLLLEDHEFYGYRKVSEEEFRKQKTGLKKKEIKDVNGFKIVGVNTYSEMPISMYSSIDGGGEWSEIDHATMSPSVEDMVLELEEDIYLSKHEKSFSAMEKSKKKNMLKKFISDNSGNKRFKDEIKAARKMLEQLNVV